LRLPTLDEAMSLVEQVKRENGLYVDPTFDKKLWCIWTADRIDSFSAWVVLVNLGTCVTNFNGVGNYACGVRSSVNR